MDDREFEHDVCELGQNFKCNMFNFPASIEDTWQILLETFNIELFLLNNSLHILSDSLFMNILLKILINPRFCHMLINAILCNGY